LLAKSNRPLSSLVDDLPSYAMVKDQYPLGGKAVDAVELFDRISRSHPEAKVDRRDGLRLDWPDHWAHVRSSNTEPIVRVIAEAADPSTARALADEIGRSVAAGRES
jgi:phosphomannomutase